MGVSFFVLPNTSILGSADENNVGRASGLVGTMRTAGILCNMVIIILTMMSVFLGHEPVTTGNMERFMLAMRTDMVLFGLLTLLSEDCTMVRSRVR